MKLAIDKALIGVGNNEGGPFGAVIVDVNGNVLAVTNNRVLIDNDPTAHAEILAIREASKKIKNYDLSGCVLYTTCEPCPMCLSALMWANIKEIYYGCFKIDANNIGFRDEKIYNYFEKKDNSLKVINICRNDCMELFKKYNNKIY